VAGCSGRFPQLARPRVNGSGDDYVLRNGRTFGRRPRAFSACHSGSAGEWLTGAHGTADIALALDAMS
jgi:hypothetical protein